MNKYVKSALVLLFVFSALLVVFALLTNSFSSLREANLIFFSVSAGLFIASIFIWLFGWAILIENRKTGFVRSVLIGFSCVFAALTPVQIGAEALRAIKLKELALVPYSESIAASMIMKGLKFLLISLLAGFGFFSYFFSPSISLWVKAAMLSGFAVVLVATLLFLLPLNMAAGQKIANIFRRLSKLLKQLERIAGYFEKYSLRLQQTGRKTILLVSALAALSLAFEFSAFLFAFLSAGVIIPIFSAIVLFSIISVLERTPFLPRGIGAVEIAGFIFLSSPSLAMQNLSATQIGAVLILFDIVRLVVPTIAGLLAYALVSGKKPA